MVRDPTVDADADAAVVARVRAGDRQAYGLLIDRYQVRLRAALSACLLHGDEIEEFTQEAFVQAFVKLEQYDSNQPFYPWVRTIAMNALRMEARARGTATRHAGDYLRQVLLERALDEREDELGEARVLALDRCLRTLPGDAAALLKDKYQGERSIAELAARHQTSEGALKVRLLRLRDRLRECIEKRLAARSG
jgi:RNA polymerase sigma-70 factor (ECF subfamily)